MVHSFLEFMHVFLQGRVPLNTDHIALHMVHRKRSIAEAQFWSQEYFSRKHICAWGWQPSQEFVHVVIWILWTCWSEHYLEDFNIYDNHWYSPSFTAVGCCSGWSVDAFNEGRWRCRHDQCCLTHLSVLDSWQTISDSSLSLQSAGGVESWQEAAMITSSMASFQNPKLIICSLYPPIINHGLLENPPFKSMIVPI